MTSQVLPPERKPWSPSRVLLTGALVVGTLDLADAIIFFGLRGVKPIRIPQSIASGLLGRSSFTGGIPTALLGVLLHYFIAFGIVATYYLASRRIRALTRDPVICGIAYGILVYCVMNLVVVPLSAAAHGRPSPPVFINGILIHMFGVGLPSALIVRRAALPA
jgi:uncharacterized membrane protein